MLSKKERLTRAEFNRFFSLGKRVNTPTIQLIFAPAPEFHGAVVVGKKVFKSAVKRNRLRRQLYGVLYRANQGQQLKSGVYIVIAKPPINKLPDGSRVNELVSLLEKGF